MDVKLFVDDKEVMLNEFVSKILSGTVTGAVASLRDIKDDWKTIRIDITKRATR